MSEVIYMLLGESGSYSDYRVWPVRAYLTRESAEAEGARLLKVLEALAKPVDADRVTAEESCAKTRAYYQKLMDESPTRNWYKREATRQCGDDDVAEAASARAFAEFVATQDPRCESASELVYTVHEVPLCR